MEVKAEPATDGASAMVEDAAEPPAAAVATPEEPKVRYGTVSPRDALAVANVRCHCVRSYSI